MFHQQGEVLRTAVFREATCLSSKILFPLAGLIGCQRIIHFTAGIEQRLLEAEGQLLPAVHGQCGTGPPLVLSVEERLCERTHC